MSDSRGSANAGEVIPAGGPVSPPVLLANDEVSRRTADVLGDSAALDPVTRSAGADAAPTWDMDVRSYENKTRVAHYVEIFSGRAKESMVERLQRGSRYEPMIRAQLRAGGLPEDMYYLALVESGFNPNAYSRAAAVGMWQFMTSTGRDMGLRIDRWVDERRDPVRSTAAAVRFIGGLRDQFGSLYLAAAAYNGGPGRVARGLAMYSGDIENADQPDDAFFVLAEKDYLRNETREYVPQLIAAALVAKEPARYGMQLDPLPPFTYDSAMVAGGTPLAAIATASGATVRVILDLNPQFLMGMVPPGSRSLVRLPVGTADEFGGRLAKLPASEREGTHTIESKKGDRVSSIAEAHGISSAALESFNPDLRHLRPSGKLVSGQSIVLPTAAVAAATLNVPDPSIERYGTSASNGSSSSSKKVARITTYTVKHGDNVGSIAKKFHTTQERLMRLNGLRKSVIFAGQDLIVGGTEATTTKSTTTKSTSEKASPKRATAREPASKKASVKKTAAKKTATAKSGQRKHAR